MIFATLLTFAAFFLSLLGTRMTILALRKRTILMDLPNLRSNHYRPTPRAGGIAVVFSMIICLLVADINYAVILPMLMLAAVSLLDDLIDIPAWIRLLVQIMAVSIPLSLLHTEFFSGLLPHWLDTLVIGLLWIWFINLFNFMDGIDGISAVEMISIGLGLCSLTIILGLFPTPLSLYSLVLSAAGMGFIWWNWHPARIFLGDVGSVPIGFFMFYLLLMAAIAGYAIPALILPAYYVADSSLTILRRLYHKKRIWQAHSEHYYQRAVRAGRSHASVARYVLGINMLLVLLASLAVLQPAVAPFHLVMAYVMVFMLLGFFAHTPHSADEVL